MKLQSMLVSCPCRQWTTIPRKNKHS